ncbi:MAG: agarase [Prolixibacteraceae bacterium]|mgnify:CR=1 FL=1|jgi:hypothetical protein|nr:agarase [Prolixibacteraceae bacterium]MBT6006688.1 agarase [Prolixibacteraceae bacterium]MBT6765181.1 agarase [Prolixibacteraceae bacterium]MBT6998539.1 agarase [Prolixibacteraceae bacterium]MBT7397292.1 agarase [Prolixibacteraceae bacterium]
MKKIVSLIFIIALFSCSNKTEQAKLELYKVDVKKRIYHKDGTRTYDDYVAMDTRSMDHLQDFKPNKKPQFSKFGGDKKNQVEASGFFRTEKIDGRWWIIDPEGYLFIHKAVNGLKRGGSERNLKGFDEKYNSPVDWMTQTAQMVKSNGFNGAGSWSEDNVIREMQQGRENQLAYTINLNFMSGYGKIRGGTYAVPGHTGYPNSTIFAFDEEFKIFCEEKAKNLVQYKNDKNLLGYFSDNEMPFKTSNLEGYLSLENKNDQGYLAAKKWLDEKGIEELEITDETRNEFLAFCGETYFSIVNNAIKKYDPNHLYLGPRLYSSEKNNEAFMTVAGKYIDVVSCNYYGRWTPREEELYNWANWTGKPFMITEWYVKGEDSGLPNVTGAGWIVKTQHDRGLFYQNYTLKLLESKSCVGWHWFKYIDNDPEQEGTELSNMDANKGIVNNDYDEYIPLLNLMKDVNLQAYDLIEFFDNQNQ